MSLFDQFELDKDEEAKNQDAGRQKADETPAGKMGIEEFIETLPEEGLEGEGESEAGDFVDPRKVDSLGTGCGHTYCAFLKATAEERKQFEWVTIEGKARL